MHAYTTHPAQKAHKPPLFASLNALRELTAEQKDKGQETPTAEHQQNHREGQTDGISITGTRRS